MQLSLSNHGNFFYKYILGMCVLAMWMAIGMYSYLGTFSRYLSDDYCEAVQVSASSPVFAAIERYQSGEWRASNRYSNLLFVGFSEKLGKNSMPITIAGMVILWPIGLIWSLGEFRRLIGVNWASMIDTFLASAFGMLGLLQAPNLFQIVYWRSAMMTHFAPLVFGTFLLAFTVRQVRLFAVKPIPFLLCVFIGFSFFILAGFSEPPAAVLVTGLILCIFGNLFFRERYYQKSSFKLLIWSFAGSFMGLAVMFFSPARMNLNPEELRGVTAALYDSFIYAYIFMLDSVKVFPVTSVLSFALPLGLALIYGNQENILNSRQRFRFILVFVICAPFLAYFLIAASFSPSAYGQGYPVERMRFLAQNLLTILFFVEGIMVGSLLSGIRVGKYVGLIELFVVLFLFLTGFVYPIRAAFIAYDRYYEEFHLRAVLWDMRDDYIKRLAALGRKDIDVPAFSGVYKIKELDYETNNWVNRCAAEYYGLQTIRAVTVPEDAIQEFLSD